ncbi:TIGR03915 family putative DNA repair protein [Caenimonas sp. SL110]|uniref:TIGR03915 family putative DNA repair protein n=1 Tax=Caenimonas sp. SL110 TaxID=1450524 RepID=UPI00069F41F4|nr:TIGR03915 family putative DNA repair protein [Caenimonas sp. SL110]
MQARLASETDIEGFREETRLLLAQQVPPDEVHWTAHAQNSEQFADVATGPKRPEAPRPASSIVPASFQRLCDVVVLHHDPERFALLYRLIWRLVYEPDLRNNSIDTDMQHAQQMGQSVRRDLHKMKSSLRFRPVTDELGCLRQMAWFEPAHRIVETVAPWFAQRWPDQAWVIFTPERSVECDGKLLHFGQGVARDAMPSGDADDAAWHACYLGWSANR